MQFTEHKVMQHATQPLHQRKGALVKSIFECKRVENRNSSGILYNIRLCFRCKFRLRQQQ